MMQWLPWVVLALPGAGALSLTAFNEVFWPRGRPDTTFEQSVSVLIPARNEARNIEKAVRGVFSGELQPDELIVYDDGSTDDTPNILARLRSEFPRLRVENGIGLPTGWVGKPHACHRLASFAKGDVLLFLDADVVLHPQGLKHLASIFKNHKAELVTAVPRQVTQTFVEKLILPLLHLTYTSWLPLPLIWLTNDPRFLAANGQVLAISRETYDAIGGFEAIKHEVVDDMAICRLAKSAKRRVVFADGHHIASCRMYQSPKEVWEGFSKNLYSGIGAHPLALLVVVALYVTTFVLPYLALIASFWLPQLLLPSLVGVGINLALRLILAVRHGHPLLSVLLHPVGVLGLMAIAFNSYLWHVRGSISWSGRVYATRNRS